MSIILIVVLLIVIAVLIYWLTAKSATNPKAVCLKSSDGSSCSCFALSNSTNNQADCNACCGSGCSGGTLTKAGQNEYLANYKCVAPAQDKVEYSPPPQQGGSAKEDENQDWTDLTDQFVLEYAYPPIISSVYDYGVSPYNYPYNRPSGRRPRPHHRPYPGPPPNHHNPPPNHPVRPSSRGPHSRREGFRESRLETSMFSSAPRQKAADSSYAISAAYENENPGNFSYMTLESLDSG